MTFIQYGAGFVIDGGTVPPADSSRPACYCGRGPRWPDSTRLVKSQVGILPQAPTEIQRSAENRLRRTRWHSLTPLS